MAGATHARAPLPTTRLVRHRRAWSGWWMGLLVAVGANLGVIAVLVKISHLEHDTPPGPDALQSITQVEPEPEDEPEPEPEEMQPQEPTDEPPPQLTLAIPALDLAAPSSDSDFSLPSLPVTDKPVELAPYVPAFSAVSSEGAPGVAAPQAVQGAPLGFDEQPELASAFDLKRFFPRQAKMRGVEGESVVRFELDKTGAVLRATVLSSTPNGVFEQAAERLARSLRFRPAKRAGVPVACTYDQRIYWKLER